jgi:hypothetical protein
MQESAWSQYFENMPLAGNHVSNNIYFAIRGTLSWTSPEDSSDRISCANVTMFYAYYPAPFIGTVATWFIGSNNKGDGGENGNYYYWANIWQQAGMGASLSCTDSENNQESLHMVFPVMHGFNLDNAFVIN